MATETDIKNLIMIELSKRGCIIFNRPTGRFFTEHEGKYTPIKINVAGASDLQGHRADGKCFYLEIKRPGHKTNKKHLQEQQNFIDRMIATNALAGFAETIEQALEIVGLQ